MLMSHVLRIARRSLPLLLLALAATSAHARQPVRSQADLPRFTYPVDRPPSKLLLTDDATFARFAAPVRADVERVLADYDIEDPGARRELLTALRNAQLLAGEDAAALATTQRIRALEGKPDARLWSGVWIEALLRARIATGARDGATFEAAFTRELAALVDPLPWRVIAPRVKEDRGRLEVATSAFIQGLVKARIDPAAGAAHAIDDDAARALLNWRETWINGQLQVARPGIKVLSAYIARNEVARPDIWTAREVTLGAADRTTPVRVAIGDTGVDPELYAPQLYTDPHTDGHDAHGLAFDLLSNPTHGALPPLTPGETEAYPGMVDAIKGQSDLLAGVDSPEADAIRRRAASLPPEQAPAFWEQLHFFSNYVHGSHVAGIAARGNPAIQLVVARITPEWRNVPTPPSAELTRRAAAAHGETVRYFRRHGVRVVNMSWGSSPAYIEQDLQKSGVGRDAAERRAIAQRLFGIDKASLEAALRSAPHILFVCSAGNDDSDSGFNDLIPSSLALPNLLTVGAVDQAGDETGFTSYGRTVRIYANGWNVPSREPGGREVPISGTSMAAPNVANLAAKLIVRPRQRCHRDDRG